MLDLRLGLGAALALLVGCGGDPQPSVRVTGSPTTIPSGDAVTLNIEVSDFELRAPPGGHQHLTAAQHDHDHDDDHGDAEALTAEGGHYHVYLDSTEVNPLAMAWTETLEVTVTASAGPHRLIVRLNADDHRFLRPEVKDELPITVE